VIPVATAAGGTTWLFVPGDRPDRFDKAVTAGADQVILDLEDSVAPTAKDQARRHVASWLSRGGHAWVRVNAVGTEWHEHDLHALWSAPGLLGVVLPKAESVADAARVRDNLDPGVGIMALVESARGVQRAAELADSGHVDRLAVGTIDLALDLGAAESDEALLLARSTVVLASRAAGLPGPVDGVTVATDDSAAVGAATARGRSLGFGGKLCIHPRQLAPVRTAYAPTEDELTWAAAVNEAARAQATEGAAFALDGRMVDRPVVLKAREILSRRPLSPTT
jgi:citrate lyase subunit beta/citryl-CoA lyase